MARKKTPAPTPAAPPAPAQPRKFFALKADPSDADAAGLAFASLLTKPAYSALRIIESAQGRAVSDQIDIPAMMALLEARADQAADGDLSHLERMLATQAVALQSLSTHLIQRGLNESLMANLEGFVRLGLKAQAQCTKTIETLHELQNPTAPTFVKQANMSGGGPMQVNNAAAPSRKREIENEQSKLLEAQHVDAGAKGQTVRVDTPLEAVACQHRAKD